jgi:ribonuclease III
MSDNLRELEKLIKYSFKNSSLLIKSLTHKSYDNLNNNEKLEFLGDRVLGLVISHKLLEKFPMEKEGIIDKKFSNLVNKKTCSLIAKKLNLKKFLFLGTSHKNLERSEDKIISDCLEALVGAIYLDGGLKSSQKFIFSFWKSYIDKSIITLVDSKTQLQEYSLKKFKILPKYNFHKKIGPQHKPLFKTEVQIPNSKKISGTGTSKKKAQQNAAFKLLKILKI